MKCLLPLLAAAAGVLLGLPAGAQDVYQRLSVKYILDGSANPPMGLYSDPAEIETVITETNEMLQRRGRGYGYVVTEYQSVVGFPQFYDLSSADADVLEITAKANPVAFFWRTNATNIYIVNSTGSNFAAIPSTDPGKEIVVMRASTNIELNWAHELGHHNDLFHPFAGDDQVADTMPDPSPNQCTQPFGCQLGGSEECCCTTKIANLDAAALAGGWTQQQKDDLLYNLMGYFGATDCDPILGHDFDNVRLTAGQLDRWTDATRLYHSGEVTGLTWFVDSTAGVSGVGYSFQPFLTVAGGVAAADTGGGDIVLLRAGSYNESMTLTKPLVLRASGGSAFVGQ